MSRFAEAPRIETERLALRAHRADDFDACARLWADREVVRHIGGTPSTRDQSWLRLLRYPGLWSLLGYGYWAIVDKASGAYVGEAGLADFKRAMSPAIEGLPEVGWIIAPKYAGRGVATEAVRAILAWADAALDAPQTVCIIDPSNTASIRVARKCGFEGPQNARFGGSRALLFRRARGG